MRGKRPVRLFVGAVVMNVLGACAGEAPSRTSSGVARDVVDVPEAEGAASGDAIEVGVYLRRPCTADTPAPGPCGRRPAPANVPVKVIFFDASEVTGTTDGSGRASIQLLGPLATISLQAGKADLVVRGVRAGSVDLSGLTQASAWRARQSKEGEAAKATEAKRRAAEAADRAYQTVALPCSTATTLDECAPLVRWLGDFGSVPENAERVREGIAVLRRGLPRGVDDMLNKLDLACMLMPRSCAELASSVVQILRHPIAEALIPDIPARLARIQRNVATANVAMKTGGTSRRAAEGGPSPASWHPPSFGSAAPATSNDDSERRHQQEIRDLQARHERDNRESERRAADAREQDARRAQEERQRAESERRSREEQDRQQQRKREEAANKAGFECYVACSRAHDSCRIGNGPDYNKACLSQLEASHNACCTGAGRRSAWPTCSCSER